MVVEYDAIALSRGTVAARGERVEHRVTLDGVAGFVQHSESRLTIRRAVDHLHIVIGPHVSDWIGRTHTRVGNTVDIETRRHKTSNDPLSSMFSLTWAVCKSEPVKAPSGLSCRELELSAQTG